MQNRKWTIFAKRRPLAWILSVMLVLTGLVAPGAVTGGQPALAAPGDLSTSIQWSDTATGAPLTDLEAGLDSRTSTDAAMVDLRIGYSCGPTACDNTTVKIPPMPKDPFYGKYAFASKFRQNLPAGATLTGSDGAGFTVALGNLAPGTSGSFTLTYNHEQRPVGASPQSFFPEGHQITASAEISASGHETLSASDTVTWHIDTPEPRVLVGDGGVARADQDYTYTLYMSASCQYERSTAGHGEPSYECAAGHATTQQLPAEAQYVSSTHDGLYDAATHTVSWTTTGQDAAIGWGPMNGLGTPRNVVVRFPASIVTDPAACIIDVSTELDVRMTYLSGTEKTASTTATRTVNACEPFANAAMDKTVSRNAGTAGSPIAWPGQNHYWNVRISNRSNIPGTTTITETFDQENLRTYSITGPVARATVTLDDGTVVESSGPYTAPAGRSIAAVTVTTTPLAGPNIESSDTSKVNFQDVRFNFTIDPDVPAEGYARSNTASAVMEFPGTPELAPLDLGSDTQELQVLRRPAHFAPALTSSVPGAGTVLPGDEVTFTMSGSTSTMDASTLFEPQYVFVAPAGWDILPGTAEIPAFDDAVFTYKTVVVNGETRQAVLATRPAGTIWGVNEKWPNMTLKATPTAAAAAGSTSTAEFYQGDAGHNYVATTATWGNNNNFRYDDAADLDGDGQATESFAFVRSTVRIGSTTSVNVLKEICQPDPEAADGCLWLADPDVPVAVSPASTGITYRVTVTNTGTAPLNGVTAYDVLPYPGDTGTSALSAGTQRGSTFAENLNAVISATGVELTYSSSTNPCRPEVYPGAPGCTDDWSGTASEAQAIRMSVPGTLDGGQSVSFGYSADVIGSPGANSLACNSVAVATLGTPVVEPRAVCAQVQEADLTAASPDTAEAQIGRPVGIPFEFANLGGTAQSAATVEILVPDGLTVTDLEPQGWACTGPTEAPLEGPARLLCTPEVPLETGSTSPLRLAGIATAGEFEVTASVSGPLYDRDPANNTTTTKVLAAAPAAALAVTKTDGTDALVPGEETTYSITVANPLAHEELTGIEVADVIPAGTSFISADSGGTFADGTLSWTVQTLGADGTATLTATLKVDTDAPNSITNTVSATAQDPAFAGEELTGTAADTNTVDRLELSKTAVLSNPAAPRPGDTVNYTFEVTNGGGGALSEVAITDSMEGLGDIVIEAWPALPGHLGAGHSVTGTASYQLTAADVDSGTLENTAVATGLSGGGGAASATDTATLQLPGAPALLLQKSATTTAAQAGDRVDFTFTATNTGNTTLREVAVEDRLEGLSGLSYQWPGEPGVLGAGQHATATASYTATQADIDAGVLRNEAALTGTPPSGEPIGARDAVTVYFAPNPALSIEKSGIQSDPAGKAPGDTITYTFEIGNTGNVTLGNLAIVDGLEGLSAITVDWPQEPGTLAPGQGATATATYLTTQADVDAGRVENAARVSGTSPDGATATAVDSTTVSIPADPSIALTKAGTLDTDTAPRAGDTVTYTFEVANTGSLTVQGVGIADGAAGLSEIVFGQWPGSEGVLAPGERVVASASYALTQIDIDRGSVENSAKATGTAASGAALESTDSDTLPLTAAPAMALEKSAAFDADTAKAGDTVAYAFTARNTGNVTLTAVAITDALDGVTAPDYSWPRAEGVLAPGETVTANASYTLTQTDVDRGSVDNAAAVNGTGLRGGHATAADAVTLPLPTLSSLALRKSAVLAEAEEPAAGVAVEYSFEIANTGHTTLTGLQVIDTMPRLSQPKYTWPGTDAVLAPGEVAVAKATYLLTQHDLDHGTVFNAAVATGTSPAGEFLEAAAEHSLPLPARPAMAFGKTGAMATEGNSRAGDEVLFTFAIENTGNQTLSGISVTDGLDGLSEITFATWPGREGTLAPGEQAEAGAVYRLTQADIDAGHVDNNATAAGIAARGGELSKSASTTVNIAAAPGLEIVKSAKLADENGDGLGNPGEKITYSFDIMNTGNVTIANAVVDDPMVTGLRTIEALSPGEILTLHSDEFVVTQAVAEAGEVVNTALATGAAPDGTRIASEPSTATTKTAPGAASPVDPIDPAPPVEPTEPGEPSEPAPPVEPSEPDEPSRPVESSEPSMTPGRGQPAPPAAGQPDRDAIESAVPSAPAADLAQTGASVAWLMAAGILVAAAGATLVLVASRKRKRHR